MHHKDIKLIVRKQLKKTDPSHWLILAATQLLLPSMGVVHAAQVAGLLYVWRNVVQVAVSFPVGVGAGQNLIGL